MLITHFPYSLFCHQTHLRNVNTEELLQSILVYLTIAPLTLSVYLQIWPNP